MRFELIRKGTQFHCPYAFRLYSSSPFSFTISSTIPTRKALNSILIPSPSWSRLHAIRRISCTWKRSHFSFSEIRLSISGSVLIPHRFRLHSSIPFVFHSYFEAPKWVWNHRSLAFYPSFTSHISLIPYLSSSSRMNELPFRSFPPMSLRQLSHFIPFSRSFHRSKADHWIIQISLHSLPVANRFTHFNWSFRSSFLDWFSSRGSTMLLFHSQIGRISSNVSP